MAQQDAIAARTSHLDWMWLLLPYALLIACSVLMLASGDLSAGQLPWMLAAGLAVAVWHGWWTIGHRHWLETRLGPMAVYYVGLVGLTAYLFHLSFNFFPLYLSCYAMAFVALPGVWAFAGVAVTSVVALLGPNLLDLTVENVVVTLGGAALASAAGWSIRALESETNHRRLAMTELAQVQADLERTLADNVALQDRLVTEARQSGVASERARIAGEIHDTVAAGLTAIISQLEAVDAQLDPGHPLRHRVRASADMARESLGQTRQSVHALRSNAMGEVGLPAALDHVISNFTYAHRLPVQITVTGDAVELSADIEEVLLLAAQESLTNVAKHAQATHAHVTLSYMPGSVALDVTDNGHGFSPGHWDGDGQGLAIMRERIEALSGELTVDGAAAHGTSLTASVPVQQMDPAAHG